jgi:predicted MPP superfamily phosphohydrolase
MLTSTILFYLAAAFLAVAGTFVVRRQGVRPISVILWSSLVLANVGLLLPVGFGEGPFGILRHAAHGLFGLLPLVVCGFAVAVGGWRRVVALLVAGLLWAGAFYAFRIEPFALEVSRHRVVSDEISRPLRIAVLADLQTERIGEYELVVLRTVAALHPDLVIFSGDYLHVGTRADYLEQALRFGDAWRRVGLEPRLGGVAVGGDVDPPGLWHWMFEGLPVRALRTTTTVRLGELSVTGLSMSDSGDPSLQVPGAPRLHIVVGHRPDFALGLVDADLLLAGHTHGGQVRLPGVGPLVTASRVPRSWAAGRTALTNDRTLIVSRGIGMERGYAPQLRFLCRPELVVVDVEPRRED